MHAISSFIRAAVPEVFSTMLEMKARPEESDQPVAQPISIDGVCGGVSFTGAMTGVLYLNLSDQTAKVSTNKVLGGSCLIDDDAVNDVVGELTNMITGNLKSKMADKGFSCRLSIPTVMRGHDVHLEAKEANLAIRNVFHLEGDTDETLTVDIFARLEDEK